MLDNYVDKPLTSEENEALAVQVRAGDEKAREDMMLGNIALAKHKVNTWITLYPHLHYLYEDMLSEGVYGLVRAIDRMSKHPGKEDSNPTGLLSVAITQAIGRFVAREEKEPKIPLPEWVANTVEDRDPTEFVDFVDSLYGACDSEEHRIILRMRAEGASEKEIAQVLDCSQQTISIMLDEIRQNFEDEEE